MPSCLRWHPRKLRNLANVIARLLLIIFDHGNWRNTQRLEGGKCHAYLQEYGKKDPENSRPDSLSSIPGKVVEQLILETISRHIWEKKIIRSRQHGFKGKSCLTNFNNFCNEMTGLANERRTMYAVYLGFRAFALLMYG